MTHEWLLLVETVLTTAVLALGAIRFFSPQILGIPIDLQSVKVSREVPPFFRVRFGPAAIHRHP